MVPGHFLKPQDLNDILENPTRGSAIHFGAYLQLQGLLTAGDDANYGNIEQAELLKVFSNKYQPRYHSQLELQGLVNTLLKCGVIKKNRRGGSSLVRILKHPDPLHVRAPEYKPRVRLFVDQTQVLREKWVRSDVVCQEKCRLCGVSFLNGDIKAEHVNSDLHQFRMQYRDKRSSFKSVVGKSSLDVVGVDNADDIIMRPGQTRNFTVRATLDSTHATAQVFEIIPLDQLQANVKATPVSFSNGEQIEVHVSATFTELGAYIYPLLVNIMPKKLCLLKDLIFRVESELMDQLAPTSVFVKRKDIVREMMGSILPAEELPRGDFKLQIKVGLGGHNIPAAYNRLLLKKLKRDENMTPQDLNVLDGILKLLCGSKTYQEALSIVGVTKAPYIDNLSKDNYSERFALLVDFQELQEQHQIKLYDRSKQTLKQRGSTFLLEIPDLSEGRPSVRRGDKVHVRLQDNDKVTYQGIIHEVQEEGILLGFHREFLKEYEELKKRKVVPRVDVRFTVNRFPMLNMHRALTLIKKHNAFKIVLPQLKTYNPPTKCSLNPWKNELIASNPEQQRAVQKIMSKQSGSAPYLVFGPPGTGKTVTLVETIVQVWLNQKPIVMKQLVSAPSNSACDNLAKRLIMYLPAAKIFRLYSLSTEPSSIPAELLKHCNYSPASKQMMMPTIDEIQANHIIIATIVTSGRLVTGGMQGMFDFVYIDECGQASEPEALIAIAGILTTKKCASTGQLVLAGDPQQLGPVLSSQLVKNFGLGMSLLERLMNHVDLYKKNKESGYDSNYLTKLVQNFRSHQAILHIPNKLFYDKDLTVKGEDKTIMKAVGWQGLPNKQFPLIFHGVQGLDERESNSPSYFNRQEIDRVVKYIQQLMQSGLPNYKVAQKDIGVITPYRKQVQKFRQIFTTLKWKDIKVASVEEFQGDERLIIFISTVRSNMALVEEDYRFNLGFLKNPKRFNVSITRAQALLIVVGNPNILRHDKYWYELLKYCQDNGAMVGATTSLEDPPKIQPDLVAG